MSEPVPAWLVAWREQQAPQSPAQRESSTRRHPNGGKRAASAVAAANRPKPNWHGFVEPERWPNDGGTRREPVLDCDHNPPRVVRHVGWRTCMSCGSAFFSEDVIALRLCDGPDGCRDVTPRQVNYPKTARRGEGTTCVAGAARVHRAEG